MTTRHSGPSEVEYKYGNGDPVPQGVCVVPGEFVDHFTISIRSLNGVSAERIRDLIQSRFKVDQIEQGSRTVYVRETRKMDH